MGTAVPTSIGSQRTFGTFEGVFTPTLLTIDDQCDAEEQQARLRELTQLSRIRGQAIVSTGEYMTAVDEHPADLNIFGMQPDLDFDVCRALMRAGRASAVFVRRSGSENALA